MAGMLDAMVVPGQFVLLGQTILSPVEQSAKAACVGVVVGSVALIHPGKLATLNARAGSTVREN